MDRARGAQQPPPAIVRRAQADAEALAQKTDLKPQDFARHVVEAFEAHKSDVGYQRVFASVLVRTDAGQQRAFDLAQQLVVPQDNAQRAQTAQALGHLMNNGDGEVQTFLFQTVGGTLAQQPVARLQMALGFLKDNGASPEMVDGLANALQIPQRQQAAEQIAENATRVLSRFGVDPNKLAELKPEQAGPAMHALASYLRDNPTQRVELQGNPMIHALVERAVALSTEPGEHQRHLVGGLARVFDHGDGDFRAQLSRRIAARLVDQNDDRPFEAGGFGAQLESVIRENGRGARLVVQLEADLRKGFDGVEPHGDRARQAAELYQRAMTDLMARAEGEKPPLEGERVLEPLDALRNALPAAMMAASLFDSEHAEFSRTAIGVLTGLPTLLEGKKGNILLRRELVTGRESPLVAMLTQPAEFNLPEWDKGQKAQIRAQVNAVLKEAEARNKDPELPALRRGARLVLGTRG